MIKTSFTVIEFESYVSADCISVACKNYVAFIFSDITINYRQNSALHMLKCFNFWGLYSPRLLTGALSLDSSGDLRSQIPYFRSPANIYQIQHWLFHIATKFLENSEICIRVMAQWLSLQWMKLASSNLFHTG